MRKVLFSLVAVTVCVGLAMADEFTAVITKVDGDKVTFHKTKFNKEEKKVEKGAAETLPAKADVKVVKGTPAKGGKVEAGDAIEGGLKAVKIGEKGVNARIITDDGNKNIVEIRVIPSKKKKDAE